MRPNPSFFFDSYFNQEVLHESHEVAIDIMEDKPRMTPYVHPMKEGKIVESLGYRTKSVAPAYLKDKRVHNPLKALRRVAGEPLTGSMSNDQRRQMNLMWDMNDQMNMLARRQEVMAVEVCLTGKIRIKGDGFDSLVDFERDSSLTVELSQADCWANDDVDLVEQFENYSNTVFDKSLSGAIVTDIIMDRKAWNLFRKHKKIIDLLEIRRGGESNIELGPRSHLEGIQYNGSFGDYNLWVYKGSYIDPLTNEAKNYLPDYTALFMSKSLDGVRHYGAILDEASNLGAQRYFSKSWTEEDPSARLLMHQSAPLLVPYDQNACMAVKVHDDSFTIRSRRSSKPKSSKKKEDQLTDLVNSGETLEDVPNPQDEAI